MMIDPLQHWRKKPPAVSRCSIQWSTSAIHLFKVHQYEILVTKMHDFWQRKMSRSKNRSGGSCREDDDSLSSYTRAQPNSWPVTPGFSSWWIRGRRPVAVSGVLCFGMTRCSRWMQSCAPLIWAVHYGRDGSGMRVGATVQLQEGALLCGSVHVSWLTRG